MEIRGRCGCSSTYFWPIFTPTPKSFRFLPLALTHKSLRKIDVTTHCNLNRRDVCKKKKCTPVIIKPPIFQSVSPQQGRGSCWSPIPGSIGWRPVRGVPDDNRDRAPARPRPSRSKTDEIMHGCTTGDVILVAVSVFHDAQEQPSHSWKFPRSCSLCRTLRLQQLPRHVAQFSNRKRSELLFHSG